MVKIAFQGELGAYSHIAAKSYLMTLRLKLVQLLRKHSNLLTTMLHIKL